MNGFGAVGDRRRVRRHVLGRSSCGWRAVGQRRPLCTCHDTRYDGRFLAVACTETRSGNEQGSADRPMRRTVFASSAQRPRVAHITASTNYFTVVCFHSVVMFVPMFIAWAWMLFAVGLFAAEGAPVVRDHRLSRRGWNQSDQPDRRILGLRLRPDGLPAGLHGSSGPRGQATRGGGTTRWPSFCHSLSWLLAAPV